MIFSTRLEAHWLITNAVQRSCNSMLPSLSISWLTKNRHNSSAMSHFLYDLIFTPHTNLRYNRANELRNNESRLDVTGDKWNNHNGASRHKAGRLGKSNDVHARVCSFSF